ncbi:uncharacterized protein LOC126685072 [Mercurialis annua]|uniref:uncharacterized protein LOC126685072 n=1 Tax=Mercurialis annua TaxID=3986 RepID=UPI00215DE407|nr:uncharacterized protein LOC126685072 [Mercurialis annua]XP_050235501.1 uncharacterized protein LOC126685072 [Mercurialis annua]XP_050235510.1 uncharacterized protein LOC126685072 [Mercurialis annua]
MMGDPEVPQKFDQSTEPTKENEPIKENEPTAENEPSKENEPTKENENEELGEHNEEEDEEVGECGFCLFMKGGGCKDTFVAWEDCVQESENKNEDIVEKCFEVTAALKKCMEAHADYYMPILQAEKSQEEEIRKQLDEEKAQEEEIRKQSDEEKAEEEEARKRFDEEKAEEEEIRKRLDEEKAHDESELNVPEKKME